YEARTVFARALRRALDAAEQRVRAVARRPADAVAPRHEPHHARDQHRRDHEAQRVLPVHGTPRTLAAARWISSTSAAYLGSRSRANPSSSRCASERPQAGTGVPSVRTLIPKCTSAETGEDVATDTLALRSPTNRSLPRTRRSATPASRRRSAARRTRSRWRA